jgi:hypothetical protein
MKCATLIRKVDGWTAPAPDGRVERHRHADLQLRDVAAQVEFESKFGPKLESDLLYSSFKRLVVGGFNLGLIGSTCTALP